MFARLRSSCVTGLLATLLAAALTTSVAAPRPVDAASYGRPGSSSPGVATDGAARGVAASWSRPARRGPSVQAAGLTVSRPVAPLAAPDAGTTAADIPVTALAAYQRAAWVLARATDSCRLPWTLLAGIGRVESDHGRYDGARLGRDGVSHPRIIGVPLNGAGSVSKVRDTDAGLLDEDPVWDRAVGPLQFIPTTWAVVGVDADGDGRRSPDDIDDAALAAGAYLCAGTSRLDTPGPARAALLRFNHSEAYVSLVLAYAESYGSSPAAAAAVLQAVGTLAPVPAHLVTQVGGVVRQARDRTWPAVRSHSPGPVRTPGAGARGDGARGDGAATPEVPAPPSAGAGSSVPAPEPPSSPTPTPGGAPAGPPSPPTVGATGPPSPAVVEPSTEASPAPAPQTVDGVLTRCGEGWCLDGQPLDLVAMESSCAVADYDGDGSIEAIAAELGGLDGQTLTAEVLEALTGCGSTAPASGPPEGPA